MWCPALDAGNGSCAYGKTTTHWLHSFLGGGVNFLYIIPTDINALAVAAAMIRPTGPLPETTRGRDRVPSPPLP